MYKRALLFSNVISLSINVSLKEISETFFFHNSIRYKLDYHQKKIIKVKIAISPIIHFTPTRGKRNIVHEIFKSYYCKHLFHDTILSSTIQIRSLLLWSRRGQDAVTLHVHPVSEKSFTEDSPNNLQKSSVTLSMNNIHHPAF